MNTPTNLRVTVKVGQFDFMSTEKETQVHVWIWEGLHTSYYLPADQADRLKSLSWPDAIEEAHNYWASRVFIDTSRDQKEAIAEWLTSDENRAVLHAAWQQSEIRRHPVAHELAAEVERLRKRVAELETVPRIVWRAEVDGIPLDTYQDRTDAQAHCADVRPATGGTVAWYEEEPPDGDDPTSLRMYVTHSDGEELETGYVVIPVQVLASYDSEEER